MDTYHLNLSFTEFDTLKATMIISIRNLEKIQTGLQDLLDHPLPPEQYNLYLGSQTSITRDLKNMRSILEQIEAIQ
jgi:hypothetical protein